jgi:proline iminopeptidase
MEAHYFANGSFLDRPLLDGAKLLAGIPGALVHGRYDLLCPPATATALAAVWSDAHVRIFPAAGHGLEHPALFAAVEAEVARMITRLTSAASG